MSTKEDVALIHEITQMNKDLAEKLIELKYVMIFIATAVFLMFIFIYINNENFKPYISHQQLKSDPAADPKYNPKYSWPQNNEQYLEKYLEFNNFTEKNRSTFLPSNYVAIDNPATNYSPWDLDYF